MRAVTHVTDVTHFPDHPFTCACAGVQRNGKIGHIGNTGHRLAMGRVVGDHRGFHTIVAGLSK